MPLISSPPWTSLHRLGTNSSEILLSPALQTRCANGVNGEDNAFFFFPAADKAVSNAQEKRDEYLKSFLNTNLNTLTAQATFLLFYCHVVKCCRTKGEPVRTRGKTGAGFCLQHLRDGQKFRPMAAQDWDANLLCSSSCRPTCLQATRSPSARF